MKGLKSIFLFALLGILILGFFSCEKDEASGTATVSFKVSNLMEVENATSPLLINVNLDDPSHSGGTIEVSITGGTNGTDYEVSTESAEFSLEVAPNSLLASFSLKPLNDEIIEDDLPLTITITSVTGALKIGELSSLTLTIIDDDKAPEPVNVNFNSANTTISETAGTAVVELTLSEPLLGTAAIDLIVSTTSSATLGTDFDLDGQSTDPLTIQLDAGATTATVNVNILDDMDMEDTEEIVLELANVVGPILIGAGQSQFTISVIDNDGGTAPIDYLETFESNDGTATYLNDVLGFENVLLNQTLGAADIIKLTTSAGNFTDENDVTVPSDNGLNIFYNSDQDPLLFGDLDNVVISPEMVGAGLVTVNLDVAYAFKNQNNAEVTFYWSESYDGSGTFNESDWMVMGSETVELMDAEGFGNNSYKREAFSIAPTQPFYVAIRVNQTVDDTYYRTRWRFDNLKVAN